MISPIATLQKDGVNIGPVYRKLQQRTQLGKLYIGESSWEPRRLARMIEHLQLQMDGVMVAVLPIRGRSREVDVCLKTKRNEVVRRKHEMAHLGIYKTTARVTLDWFWPGMPADIRRRVLGCQVCQQSKTAKSRTSGECQHLFVSRPWQ